MKPPGGKTVNELLVSFENELVTVGDIIKARVTAEVEAYNNKMPAYFNGLFLRPRRRSPSQV
jgi:hypothetical protein